MRGVNRGCGDVEVSKRVGKVWVEADVDTFVYWMIEIETVLIVSVDTRRMSHLDLAEDKWIEPLEAVERELASVVLGAECGPDAWVQARKWTKFRAECPLVADKELFRSRANAGVPRDGRFTSADSDDVDDYPVTVLAGVRSGSEVKDEVEVPVGA